MAKEWEVEGISERIAFAAAGAKVVETRAAELIAHSDGVLDTTDIEGVHDMRVATRRLRAALEVFAPCFPRGPQRRALKEVKAIADALGERRDRDVAIESLSSFAAQMPAPDRPGINSLVARFVDEQQQANEALAPFVERKRLERLQATLAELAQAAHEAAAEAEAADGVAATDGPRQESA